jgi:hypothetical protein
MAIAGAIEPFIQETTLMGVPDNPEEDHNRIVIVCKKSDLVRSIVAAVNGTRNQTKET